MSSSLIQTRTLPVDGQGIAWEETACPLCGGESRRTSLEAADDARPGSDWRFAIVQCQDCQLSYTNPRPAEASIAQFYPADYIPYRKPTLGSSHLSWHAQTLARVFGRPCVERHRLPWHGHGRLLDVDCGGGDFLVRMHDQGWKVSALDASPTVIKKLRGEFGIKGILGTLPNSQLADESFDVITMWASLEHAYQPLTVLRDVRRILTPGGWLYLQVPNFDSWDIRLFGANSHLLELPRHTVHFTAGTLRRMLEAAGFEARQVRTESHPSWIRRTLRIAKRNRAIGLLPRLIGVNPFHRMWSTLCYWTSGGEGLFAFAQKPVARKQ